MKTFNLEDKKTQDPNKKSKTITALAGLLIVLLALLMTVIALLFPLATIWAVNTLFSLSISYTFWNWLAVVVLLLTIQGALNIRFKNK